MIAYPNRHFPPADEVLALADLVVETLDSLRPAALVS